MLSLLPDTDIILPFISLVSTALLCFACLFLSILIVHWWDTWNKSAMGVTECMTISISTNDSFRFYEKGAKKGYKVREYACFLTSKLV